MSCNNRERRKPASRIEVCCFMASLGSVAGNAIAYNAYATELLSILCARDPANAKVVYAS
jgi:hypothetical protein